MMKILGKRIIAIFVALALYIIGWQLKLLVLTNLSIILFAAAIIIFFFANHSSYRRWLQFSAFYIPISLLFVFFIYPIHFPFVERLNTSVKPFGILYIIFTSTIIFWEILAYRISSPPS